jgi:hypothetical protein
MKDFYPGTGKQGLLNALLLIGLVDAAVVALLWALHLHASAIHAPVIAVICACTVWAAYHPHDGVSPTIDSAAKLEVGLLGLRLGIAPIATLPKLS